MPLHPPSFSKARLGWLLAATMVTALQSQSAVASIISFNVNPVTASANSGTVVDNSVINAGKTYSGSYVLNSDKDIDFRAVTTAATAGKEGKIDIYKDVTTTTTTKNYSYSQDQATLRASGDNSNFASGQWIKLSGSITASEDTTLGYSLFASGNYLSTNIPGIGDVSPAWPSLFLSTGSGYNKIGYSTIYTSPTSYSLYGDGSSLSLKAGTTTTLSALIYTLGDVSIGDFGLNLWGSTYGASESLNTTKLVTSTLFKTEVLPALPVPEPETYAMLMVGLLLLAARRFSGKANNQPLLAA